MGTFEIRDDLAQRLTAFAAEQQLSTDEVLALLLDEAQSRQPPRSFNGASKFTSLDPLKWDNPDELRVIVEGTAVGIALVNLDQRVMKCNWTLARMLGYRPEELVGKTIEELTYPPDRPNDVRLHDMTAGDHSEMYQVEKRYIRKDGSLMWASLIVSLIRDHEGQPQSVVGIVEDISERKRAQDAEREQRALAEALIDMAASLSSVLDLHELLDQILIYVSAVVPYDTASIMLVEGDTAYIAHARGFEAFGSSEDVYGLRFSIQDTPKLQRLQEMTEPWNVPDTAQEPEWLVVPETAWIRSHLAAPIRVGDDVIGLLNLDKGTLNAFDQEHAQRLQAFANQVAVAVRNARLYDQITRYTHELEQRVIDRTAELWQTKERVETVLNNTSDGIAVVDARGIIQQSNRAFETLFSLAERPQPTTSLFAHFTPADHDLLQSTIDGVMERGESARLEMTALRYNGPSFAADVALSPILSADRHAHEMVCSVRDVSERKQTEANLRLALAKERELSDLKSRFVSMVSHEFRTPLATIMSSSELLKLYIDRLDEEARVEKLNRIQAQVKHLTGLLNSVLFIGRTEQLGLSTQLVPVELESFCRLSVEEIRLIDDGSHDLVFLGGCHPGPVLVDESLLRQMLYNLLSNAVKYSPGGGQIALELMCEPDTVVLRVRDEGIGIPQEDLEHLFELFYRAGNAATIPGTGIGLVIVKQVVDVHDGTIEVDSNLGRGTVFTVRLPLRQESSADVQAVPTAP